MEVAVQADLADRLERVGRFLPALSVNAHGHKGADKTTQRNEGSRFHDPVN
jgi:hypothetical protein